MATRVYIGRLARDARERDVEKLFRNYGTIREIKLMNGFGFVEFRDHRDADDVVYAFNGKSFMGENRFAPPQRNPQYRLIVENLSSSCSWQLSFSLWLLDVAFGFCLPFRLMATLLKICLDYILLYIPQKSLKWYQSFSKKTAWEKKDRKQRGYLLIASRSDSFGPIIWITIYFYSWDLPALVPSIGIGTWHMEITQEPMRIVEAYRPFTITQSKPPSPTPLPF
ncbi:18174_t:CDS:2 [Dentiscutata erythropus]|uniref:18174_t:CDS:1 n=1 Tax=Dentiscutata erythropus TaxID=1348616 RepID=A0A9N9NP52_9GLOM|nr:18174_t:CDS:2 [Dentiscutata erythropus]